METDSTSKEQSFYIAVILYESSSSASEDKPLYEECFVLIKATSLKEANEKALAYIREQQGSYQNEYNDTITWFFKQLVDVNSVLDDEFDNADSFRPVATHTQSPYLSS